MSIKKKVLISVILVIIATLVAGLVGFFINNDGKELLKMENPYTITYYANEEKTEGFSLQLSNNFSSKITVSVDKPIDGLQSYSFKHSDSNEILFIVYISDGEAYKQLSGKYEVLDKSDKYTYVWTQSVEDNTHILDETKRKEFNEIAKYYATIKSTVQIVSATGDNAPVTK